jgi:hypothetical protein
MSERTIVLGAGGAFDRQLAERIWDPEQLLREAGL